MKSTKYILGDLDLDRMEAIFEDSSVPAPKSLGEDLEKSVDLLSALDGEPERGTLHWKGKVVSPARSRVRRLRTWASMAAGFLLVAGLGLGYLLTPPEPEDTFTDPALAYAQVAEVMGRISDKVAKGKEAAALPGQILGDALDSIL